VKVAIAVGAIYIVGTLCFVWFGLESWRWALECLERMVFGVAVGAVLAFAVNWRKS